MNKKNVRPISVVPDEKEEVKTFVLEEEKQEEVKRFVLEEEKQEEEIKIDETDDINEISVVYEDVNSVNKEEDFVITNITPSEEVSELVEIEDEDQFSFTFDLPLQKGMTEEEANDNAYKKIDINDIEIIGLEEIRPEPIVDGKMKHNLEEEFAPELNTLKSISDNEKGQDENLDFELKVEKKEIKETKVSQEVDKGSQDISPMNLTISELKNKAEDRRQKMKEFNYKFINKMNQNVGDSESQPAYKRMGVSLTDVPSSSEIDNDQSRMSLGTDDEDKIQLRSNNSFLHDNVD